MRKLRILMAASEAGPYARTGGLGDVIGALPAALGALGHEVKVFLPGYSSIKRTEHRINPLLESLAVPDGDETVPVLVERADDSPAGVEFLFIGCDRYFDRSALYVDPKTGVDFEDNARRFAFFSRATLEAARQLAWRPDIVHCHDWQTSLLPAYLQKRYLHDPVLRDVPSVLTIHNLGYQGLFDGEEFEILDLPEDLFYAMTGPLEFYGKLNFLKGGIVLADKITTVSPRYAQEIQSGEEFGCGLEGVLTQRSGDLSGILNGADYTIWSPEIGPMIPHRYNGKDLSGKRANRLELHRQAGLAVEDSAPLIGMVTRLAAQKGIDLLMKAAGDLLTMNCRLIVLGTGEAEYHRALQKLEKTYPDRFRVFLEFNDAMAHLILAGADIFLMPSRYEPCGLNQMYALKYGTVPVVRAVGGLADTVRDYDTRTGAGTGFRFDDYSAKAMLAAVKRAVTLFRKPKEWTRLMQAGMAEDFSWAAAAARYSELYLNLADKT